MVAKRLERRFFSTLSLGLIVSIVTASQKTDRQDDGFDTSNQVSVNNAGKVLHVSKTQSSSAFRLGKKDEKNY